MGKKSEIDWVSYFEEFELSEKSRRAFCNEKGIVANTFGKYYSRYKKENEKQEWVEAKLPEFNKISLKEELAPIKQPTIEISAGKFKISLLHFDASMLEEIIGVVGRLC